MAYQTIKAGRDWPDAPHYTASGETDIEIVNPMGLHGYFVTTIDDNKPDLKATSGSPVEPAKSRALTLLDGERLWLVAPHIDITFTLMT